MRQNVVGNVNTSVRRERNKAFKAIVLQMLVVLTAAAVYCFFTQWASFIEVLFGGLASLLPSFLFATLIFTFFNPHSPKQVGIIFFIGETVKLIASAGLLAAVIVSMPGSLMPAVLGFFAAWLGNWIAPMLLNCSNK